jgi:hypothetical protein
MDGEPDQVYFFASGYKRLAARRGKKRAIVALGHEILIVVFHILRDKCGMMQIFTL